MYHYLDDKEFESKKRKECGEIMQGLCHILKKKYDIGANFYLVGSGDENLITQNDNGPIDFDYNLEILSGKDIEDCRILKETVRNAFDTVLFARFFAMCERSKSVLRYRTHCAPILSKYDYGIDICITRRDEHGKSHRLIYREVKYGNIVLSGDYIWNEAPDREKIDRKVKTIKSLNKWDLVRTQYVNLKNMYHERNDQDHPSFICFYEAVNNVYNSLQTH